MYAPTNTPNVVGFFREATYKKPFEYAVASEPVLAPDMATGRNTTYPHIIFVGPNRGEYRRALVLKTVAYVMIDERLDEHGNMRNVIERWDIRSHRQYPERRG